MWWMESLWPLVMELADGNGLESRKRLWIPETEVGPWRQTAGRGLYKLACAPN
jgi:hypothetical protein